MKKEARQTIKLGVFVFVGLTILSVAIFLLGRDQTLFEPALYLRAEFNNVNGLQRGNNVWLAGVKVGTVASVNVLSDTLVEVKLRIRKIYHSFIKEDAIAQLTRQGLMGNPLIVLKAGKSNLAARENQLLASYENKSAHDIGDELKTSGENIAVITTELRKLMQQASDGHGLIGELFEDKGLALEAKKAIMKLEITADHTALLTGDISSLVRQIEKNKHGLISTLITDSTLSTVIGKSLVNIRVTSENVAQLTGNFKELSNHLEHGNNALGLILTDTTFSRNLNKGSLLLKQDLEAAQHSFLLRGYLKRKKKAN